MSKRKSPRGPGQPDAAFSGSRRRFLGGVAASTAALAVPHVAQGLAVPELDAASALPVPGTSGIDHVVVVMMENRSFDHFLGWVPRASGPGKKRSYVSKSGEKVQAFHLAPDPAYGYQGCGKEDPNHNYNGGRVHYNGGKMDGFLRTVGDENVATDHFPVGYYTADDLPFFSGAARHFTVCDHYFHGILSSTFPNRMYLHAGQTDRNNNTTETSTLPTIWDRLRGAGASVGYYFHDLPVTALWGDRYLDISHRYEQFQLEAAAGLLPNLSIVDPRFLGEAPNGVSNDDHPQADVRNGQAFLNSIYDAMRNGPQWERSLLVICYDEWGGFFDHVAPPYAPVAGIEATFNDGLLGFRVPCVILGPRARRGHVAHQQFDVNSILNLLTWRFGAEPLGVRGGTSANLAKALDFKNPPGAAGPDFGVPAGPFGVDCSTGAPMPIPNTLVPSVGAQQIYENHNGEWLALREKALASGFVLP